MSGKVLHILSQRPGRTGSGITLDALVRQAGAADWTQRALVGVPAGEVRPEVGGLDPELVARVTFGRDDADLPFPVPGMSDVMPYPSSVWSTLSDRQLAEEVVQDSFVEISQRFEDLGQPGAYLRTVVVSRCRSHLRRRRVMQHHAPTRPPDLPPEAESLWDVLEHLPEHQRIPVVLKYYCGYRASEIAKITDQRPGWD